MERKVVKRRGFSPLLFLIYLLITGQIGVPRFEYDFGSIKANTEASHVFEIENNNNEPLIVEYVEAG